MKNTTTKVRKTGRGGGGAFSDTSNLFPTGNVVLPFLVPPKNGLKERLSNPGTLGLRHLLHPGMHNMLELKWVVIRRHISKGEELCQ